MVSDIERPRSGGGTSCAVSLLTVHIGVRLPGGRIIA